MRRFLAILAVFTCIKGTAQNYQGDSWSEVKANGKGKLTIIYYEQPGFIYKENGIMKGVCAEIISDFVAFVKKNYGKTVEVNYASQEKVFTEFLRLSQTTKDILGVTNVTITEERKKIFKFTPPVLSNPLVLLTHKNAPNVSTLAEIGTLLPGYTAEIIAGSTHVKQMEKIKKNYAPAMKVEYVENGSGILKDIVADPKVISILDFIEYIDAVRRNLPVKNQKVDLGATEDLAFVMSKQSDWDEPWNAFLTDSYRKSSRYKKIIADNLGATFLGILK